MKQKWTLFWFWTGDFKAVERYLNEQAAKGWELEKTRIIGQWKRTDRQDLTYCVDLANPKDDENDRKAYADFCAEGGWTQVGFVNQMYIFKSMPDSVVTPIQTDPEMEWKNYKKYFLKRMLLCLLLGGIGILLNGANLLVNWGRTVESLHTQWGLQALLIICLLLILWRASDFIRAMVSNRGGKIAESPRWVMWTNCVLLVVVAAAMAIALIMIVMILFQTSPFKGY